MSYICECVLLPGSVTRLTLVVFENHVVSRWSLLHFYGNPRAYSRAWSLGVSRKWASLELFIPWASRAMICLLRCLLVLNGHYWGVTDFVRPGVATFLVLSFTVKIQASESHRLAIFGINTKGFA